MAERDQTQTISHTCEQYTGRMKSCPACRRARSATPPCDLADRLDTLVRQNFREPDKYRTQIVLAAAERLRMYAIMEDERRG